MSSKSRSSAEPSDHSWDRRRFLGKSSAVVLSAALAGRMEAKAPQDVQRIDQAQHDKSATDVGPENHALKDSNPSPRPSPNRIVKQDVILFQ
jgi:hypothetical protein